ncbi:SAVED domain-containing protein [Streptomyces hydrogenans]
MQTSPHSNGSWTSPATASPRPPYSRSSGRTASTRAKPHGSAQLPRNRSKKLAARHGHAEVHLAFHGPYTMALLVGRHLNTLRTVVYEWDNATLGKPLYTPALVLEPGVADGPITEVLLNP